ncbi:hypothetical protein [Halobacillus sp. BAB-2008]|uniref:hypothetical protein n=1 Tax=Halobacillus sp. BAB-2008 TaxID=1246484 RepID=UPI0003005466|nr:hypothetical protein [Halobacillus sp. BAB-2008]
MKSKVLIAALSTGLILAETANQLQHRISRNKSGEVGTEPAAAVTERTGKATNQAAGG